MKIPTAIKGNYFFFFFAMATFFPYLAPYFKELCDMSDRQVGILFMIRPAVALCAQPVLCYYADTSGKRPQITSLLAIGAGVSFLMLSFTRLFWPMLIILILWAFFYSPIIPLSDSITFSFLGRKDRRKYTQLRIYGTVGFMVSAPLLGWLFDHSGLQWQFPIFCCMMIASSLYIRNVPASSRIPSAYGVAGLKLLYTNRNIVVFVAAALIMAISNQMAFVFLSVHVKNIGATNTNLGLMWIIATAVETALMPFVGAIITRIGVRNMIVLGLLASCVRWTATAFITEWWQILPLQMLHGITFCFIYVGAVTFMDMESPESVRSSAQGFYATFVMNGGHIIAGPIGGDIAQRFGYTTLFCVCAGLSLVSSVIISLLVREPASEERGKC
jgi:PPP family 3-phenylpropionic acid transporter